MLILPKSSVNSLIGLFFSMILLASSGCSSGGQDSSRENPSGIIKGRVTASSSVSFKTLKIAFQETITGAVGIPGAVCTLEGNDKNATTDENGYFQISGVTSGSYIIICKKTATNGKVYAFLSIVDVQPSQTTDLGTIEITQTGSIQGTANLADRIDHTGITVYIPGTSLEAKTDALGTYLINNVPMGTYEVRFEKSGYKTTSFTNVIAASGESILTDAVTLDAVNPVLSNIKTLATGTTATISWQTTKATTGQVNYGLNQNYGNSQIDSSPATNHTILLTGLSPQTLYHYQIVSTDTTGDITISTDLTFKTTYDPIVNPNISINIVQPSQGALTDIPLMVTVTVDSLYELKNVKARVDGIETNLSFSSNAVCTKWGCGPGWGGSISIIGMERGEKLLIVTASDVFGNTTEATQSFIFDQKPILSVTDPLDGTVARPQLHISASCADDDSVGCTSITVKVDGTVVATGQSSIDENVSLISFDGGQVTLWFEARDSANQIITKGRVIYVESRSILTEVESVNGSIWDVQLDRILSLDKVGSEFIVKIWDRILGQETIIPSIPGKVPQYGFLTPKGAIFIAQDTQYHGHHLYEWRDGSFANIDNYVNSGNSLKVKGNYAIWNMERTLILRDLLTGTNTTISTETGNWMNDVAANGDVVYWGCCYDFDYNIYRYRQGTITRLTNDIGGVTTGVTFENIYPLTDGINVAYIKSSPPSSGSSTSAIAIYGSAGEIILSPARSQGPSPGLDYQLNNGWIAFTRSGSGGELQIWVRSPSGQETQITFWGTSSRIDALSPNGEVTFVNGNRLYLSGQGLNTIDICSSLCKSFWQDGRWFVIIGRTLFSINQ